jgi:hypothetical protein
VPAPRLAPVPSWRGLRACLPRGSEPRAGALEAEPVATGFGAHAHVLLSPRMMTNAGLGPGDWVALAIRGDTGGGGESASDGSVDDDSDAPNAPSAALTSALLARNLPALCVKERNEDEDDDENVSDERAQLGRHVVLARAPKRQGVVARRRRAGAENVDVARAPRRRNASMGLPAGRRSARDRRKRRERYGKRRQGKRTD